MKAFYASHLSDNISQTPEGYLVCRNVPIARTGWQDYAPHELDLPGSDIVHVWRDPAEVFSAATVASFEGKSITDGHPPEFVSPANEGSYHRGHAQHIRRGSLEDSANDALLADLIIKDANLISKIQAGLREISCGYACEYVPMAAMDYDYAPSSNGNGAFAQKTIRGNHIAVVASGRAGESVCIRDSAEELEERRKPMSFSAKHILGLGFKTWAKDAEPEAVANAIDDYNEKAKEQSKERNEDDDKGKDKMKDAETPKRSLEDRITDLCDRFDAMEKRLTATDEEEKEGEIKEADDDDDDKETDDEEEEKQEESDDAEVVPVETLPEGERPKNPIPGADALRKNLIAIRPIVARSKDKKAIDSFNKAWRSLQPPKKGGTKDGYKQLLRRRQPDETKDAFRTLDASTDFLSRVKPYHRRNIQEVARERELQRLQDQKGKKVS